MASKYNFNPHFGVLWRNFINIAFFFQSMLILLNKNRVLKCFRDLFEIKHTECSHPCIFPLPYIVISEIGISFSITNQVALKFVLYRIDIFDISFLWKHRLLNETSILFQNLRNFTSIRLGEGC